jgi:hypothetical protein
MAFQRETVVAGARFPGGAAWTKPSRKMRIKPHLKYMADSRIATPQKVKECDQKSVWYLEEGRRTECRESKQIKRSSLRPTTLGIPPPSSARLLRPVNTIGRAHRLPLHEHQVKGPVPIVPPRTRALLRRRYNRRRSRICVVAPSCIIIAFVEPAV